MGERMLPYIFVLVSCGGSEETESEAIGSEVSDTNAPDTVSSEADCVRGLEPTLVDGVLVPACGCCPPVPGSCFVQPGGARDPEQECGAIIDLEPPCEASVDPFGCPKIECHGSCLLPNLNGPRVHCNDDRCLSGLVQTIEGGSVSPTELTITSPCGPGRATKNMFGNHDWVPEPCEGETAISMRACDFDDCEERSTTVRQFIGAGFAEPSFDAVWRVGARETLRLVLGPTVLTDIGANPVGANLEIAVDDGEWRMLVSADELRFDLAGFATWQVDVPAAQSLAFRAAFVADDMTRTPDYFPQLQAWRVVAVAP